MLSIVVHDALQVLKRRFMAMLGPMMMMTVVYLVGVMAMDQLVFSAFRDAANEAAAATNAAATAGTAAGSAPASGPSASLLHPGLLAMVKLLLITVVMVLGEGVMAMAAVRVAMLPEPFDTSVRTAIRQFVPLAAQAGLLLSPAPVLMLVGTAGGTQGFLVALGVVTLLLAIASPVVAMTLVDCALGSQERLPKRALEVFRIEPRLAYASTGVAFVVFLLTGIASRFLGHLILPSFDQVPVLVLGFPVGTFCIGVVVGLYRTVTRLEMEMSLDTPVYDHEGDPLTLPQQVMEAIQLGIHVPQGLIDKLDEEAWMAYQAAQATWAHQQAELAQQASGYGMDPAMMDPAMMAQQGWDPSQLAAMQQQQAMLQQQALMQQQGMAPADPYAQQLQAMQQPQHPQQSGPAATPGMVDPAHAQGQVPMQQPHHAAQQQQAMAQGPQAMAQYQQQAAEQLQAQQQAQLQAQQQLAQQQAMANGGMGAGVPQQQSQQQPAAGADQPIQVVEQLMQPGASVSAWIGIPAPGVARLQLTWSAGTPPQLGVTDQAGGWQQVAGPDANGTAWVQVQQAGWFAAHLRSTDPAAAQHVRIEVHAPSGGIGMAA